MTGGGKAREKSYDPNIRLLTLRTFHDFYTKAKRDAILFYKEGRHKYILADHAVIARCHRSEDVNH